MLKTEKILHNIHNILNIHNNHNILNILNMYMSNMHIICINIRIICINMYNILNICLKLRKYYITYIILHNIHNIHNILNILNILNIICLIYLICICRMCILYALIRTMYLIHAQNWENITILGTKNSRRAYTSFRRNRFETLSRIKNSRGNSGARDRSRDARAVSHLHRGTTKKALRKNGFIHQGAGKEGAALVLVAKLEKLNSLPNGKDSTKRSGFFSFFPSPSMVVSHRRENAVPGARRWALLLGSSLSDETRCWLWFNVNDWFSWCLNWIPRPTEATIGLANPPPPHDAVETALDHDRRLRKTNGSLSPACQPCQRPE